MKPETLRAATWQGMRFTMLLSSVLLLQASAVFAFDAAVFVELTTPGRMEAGRRYPVTIRVHNAGTSTWTESTGYRLAIPGTFPWDITPFGATRLHLQGSVPPGAVAVFRADLRAPNNAGLHDFRWQMVRESLAWFGPLSPPKQIEVFPASTPLPESLIVYRSIPDVMETGRGYLAEISVRNTGTETWTESSGYRLGVTGTFPWDSTPFGGSRVFLPAGLQIAPGESYTFVANLTAPASAGSHSIQFQMVHEGLEWFGPATVPKIVQVVSASTQNNAQYVAHGFVVPVDTIAGGREFVRTVRMKNTGTTIWSQTQGHRLALWYAFPWDESPLGPVRVDLPAGVVVAPGQEHTFEVRMRAPTQGGPFTVRWQMLQEGSQWFGTSMPDAQINVTPACGGTPNCIPSPLILTTMYTWFPAPHDDVVNLNSPAGWIYDPAFQDGSHDLSYWRRNLRDVRNVGVDGIFFSIDVDPTLPVAFDNMAPAHAAIRQVIAEEKLPLRVSLLLVDIILHYYNSVDATPANYVEYVYEQMLKPYFTQTPTHLWLTHNGRLPAHGGRPNVFLWGAAKNLAAYETALAQVKDRFEQDFGVVPFFTFETGLFNEVSNKSLADAVMGWNAVIGGMFHNDHNGTSVSSVGVGANDQLIRPWTCHGHDSSHPGHNPDSPFTTVRFRNGSSPDPASSPSPGNSEASFIQHYFSTVPLDVDWVFIQDANELNEGTTYLRARNLPRKVNPAFFHCAPQYYLGQPTAEVQASYNAIDNGEYLEENFYINVLRSLVSSRFPHKAVP